MKKYYLLLIIFVLGIIISGIQPHDYFTWFLEVFPALLGAMVLIATFEKFRFTYCVYVLILLHALVLFIGGHYTYAEVPLFDTIKEALGQERNNYDKVGHFMQGFVPAAIIRELLIRRNIINVKSWIPYMVLCICITISVCYEFLEWAVAIFTGSAAEDFLGTQGYVWDTQSDMLYASIGAITFLLIFHRWHDRRMIREFDKA
ncbi:Inner membrane protein YjdF [compost metagenome]